MSTAQLRTASVLGALALAAGTIGVMSIGQFAAAAAGGPTVTLASSAATTTNAASIPVTATFSESVTGFGTSSITATNATVTGFSGSGASYSFNLNPTTDGTVTAQIHADMASSSASSTGNQASNVLTFTSDRTAPSISGVSVNGVSQTGATVNWQTNEATVGQVAFGTTASYGASTTLETTGGTTHAAAITGLSASTTYHYKIVSTDAAGNATSTADATFTTSATPAPTISNVSVAVNSTSGATIMWSTDVNATGQIAYGTTTSYGSLSALNTNGTTTHSITLSGLSEATLYHFQIRSGNSVGTTTSADMTFVTQSTSSTTPLAVNSVDAVQTTATADDTYVHGWSWVMHLTVPDNENAFRMKFSDWTGSAGTFATANNVRIFSAQSSNANSEGTAITETNNNYGDWLYLTSDSATSTPGRQVDVTIEVRIPSGTAAGSYSTTFGAQSVPSTATSTTP